MWTLRQERRQDPGPHNTLPQREFWSGSARRGHAGQKETTSLGTAKNKNYNQLAPCGEKERAGEWGTPEIPSCHHGSFIICPLLHKWLQDRWVCGCKCVVEWIFSSVQLLNHTSVFCAELLAINKTTDYVINSIHIKSVIFTDSLSALNAINLGYTESNEIQGNIIDKLNSCNKDIILIWKAGGWVIVTFTTTMNRQTGWLRRPQNSRRWFRSLGSCWGPAFPWERIQYFFCGKVSGPAWLYQENINHK